MSSKKDKLLESAQKFIAKGQLERAIKEYVQIVAMDQGDIRQRQKLAELLVRVNRKLEAIEEYEIIAKHYSQGLFYLKAIAVYKQIQKLDPDNINTRFTLAALYAKQGLTGNALTEYNFLADHYQKKDSSAEALKVLEHMLEVDADNLNTRQRLAEACFATGDKERAYREFVTLAFLLLKVSDEEAFTRTSERVSRLFPDKKDFATEVLSAQIEGGGAAVAVPQLRELVSRDRSDLKAWELLADAYLKTGDINERKEVLRSIIEIFPDRLPALESLIQAHLDEEDVTGVLDLLKEHESKFLSGGNLKSLERFYASLQEKAPQDAAVLQGLKDLYETCGEQDKLASLTPAPEPSGQADEELPEPPPPPPVSSLPETAQEEHPENTAESPDDTWEEEIDLSLLDDEGSEGLFSDSMKFGAPSSPESTGENGTVGEDADRGDMDISPEEEVPFESEATSEISLEIDDSDMTGDNWQQDLAPIESGSVDTGLSEPWSEEDVAEFSFEGGENEPSTAGAQSWSEGTPLEEIVAGAGEETVESAPPGRKRKKYDIDGQFSEFKKGVDEQLDKEDTETHYNLGIAYKEMGLFDDAISEFQTAAIDPQRRIDCMTLEAICNRDKGDFSRAEEIFKDTLSQDGLNTEEELSINYELAFLCETMGRREEAVRYYQEVRAINPGFRDAAKKIAHLQGKNEDEETELLELDVEELDQ